MSERAKQAVRDVVKGAGIVYTGLVLEMAIAFLAQLIAARHLSTSGFGSLQTGLTILDLCAILATFGFANGLTRYLPRFDTDEQRRTVSRTAFLVVVPTSLLFGFLLFIGATPVATLIGDRSVAPAIRVFSAAIPFAAVLRLSLGGIRGQKHSSYRVYVENFVRPIVRFSLVAIAVYLGLDATGLAAAYAAPYVCGGIIAVWFFIRSLPRVFGELTLDVSRTLEVFRYSLPITVSQLASFIYRSSDVFIVLYFLGSSAVGVYGIAYTVGTLVLMFSTAFNYLGAPVTSELEAEEGVGEALNLQAVMLRWLVVPSIAVLVPFVLFPATFIGSVYGARYASGGAALAVLAVAFAVHNIISPYGNILQALGYSRVFAINGIVSASLNVGLNLWLVAPEGIGLGLGLTGAAIATFVSYLTLDLLTLVELRYYVGTFGLRRATITPAIVGIPLLFVTWLITPLVPETFGWIFVVSAGFCVTYAALLIVLIGFEPEELMLVRDIEHKYGIDLGPVSGVVERFS